jgi:hypothetical protein
MLVAECSPHVRDDLVVPGQVGAGYRRAEAVAQRLRGPEETGGQAGVAFGRFDAREFLEALGEGTRLAEGLCQLEAALVEGAGGRVVPVRLADQAEVGQRDRLQPAVAGEQLMTPADRRAQGPVASQFGPASAGQQPEPVAEPGSPPRTQRA